MPVNDNFLGKHRIGNILISPIHTPFNYLQKHCIPKLGNKIWNYTYLINLFYRILPLWGA